MSQGSARAAAGIAVLLGCGVSLIAFTEVGSRWENLGQALTSGALVGAVFVFAESSLAQASERRSRHQNLVQQVSASEVLVGADLTGQRLCDLYLPSKRFTAARLQRIDLSRSVLLHGDLRHATLTDAMLIETDFGGSTFERADLTRISARASSFLDANLSRAVLQEADLRGADLSYAVLRDAVLVGADLRGAKLTCADLVGADLTGVRMTGADLQHVHYDMSTRWPSGFTPPNAGPPPPEYSAGTTLTEWLVRRADLEQLRTTLRGEDGGAES